MKKTLDIFMQFHLIENIVWNKNKEFGFTMWMEPNYDLYRVLLEMEMIIYDWLC
jgi:hypothetical protein